MTDAEQPGDRPWEQTMLDEATWRMFKAMEAKDAATRAKANADYQAHCDTAAADLEAQTTPAQQKPQDAAEGLLQAAIDPAVASDAARRMEQIDSIQWPYVNWVDLFNGDHEQEWLIEPLIPEGRAVAIYAAGGAGKSFLALHMAASIATGQPWSGQAREAVPTLYLDYEMSEDDLRERLISFGFTQPDELGHFHYMLHPTLSGLDTAKGAAELAGECDRLGIRFVVIDTMARSVDGPENDNDTYRWVGKHLGMEMKRRGITYLRLDHAGKDAAKGQRGASAKNDDVDLVWRLTPAHAGTLGPVLNREKCRLADIPSRVELKVHEFDGLTDYEWVRGSGISHHATQVLNDLKALKVPQEASRRVAADALRAAGKGAKESHIAEAVRWRKSH